MPRQDALPTTNAAVAAFALAAFLALAAAANAAATAALPDEVHARDGEAEGAAAAAAAAVAAPQPGPGAATTATASAPAQLLSMAVTVAAGIAGGRAAERAFHVSPLLGMLAAGVLARNAAPWLVLPLPHTWTAWLWGVALSAVTARAGLSLVLSSLLGPSSAATMVGGGDDAAGGNDVPAASRPSQEVSPLAAALVLGTLPVVAEALFLSNVGGWAFGLPVSWALALAFGVASISPGVVVPLLLGLQERREWRGSRLPTTLLAATGVDVLVATTGFGVAVAAVFGHAHEGEGESAAHSSWLARGAEEVFLGVLGGAVFGLVGALMRRARIAEQVATWVLFILTTAAMLYAKGLGFPGAASSCVILTWAVVVNVWDRDAAEAANKRLKGVWRLAEPFLFPLIGASVYFGEIPPSLLLRALVVVAMSVVFKMLMALIAASAAGLPVDEQVLTAAVWSGKGSVQAALATVTVEAVQHNNLQGTVDAQRARIVFACMVSAILIGGPVAATLVSRFGHRAAAVVSGPKNSSEVEMDSKSAPPAGDKACLEVALSKSSDRDTSSATAAMLPHPTPVRASAAAGSSSCTDASRSSSTVVAPNNVGDGLVGTGIRRPSAVLAAASLPSPGGVLRSRAHSTSSIVGDADDDSAVVPDLNSGIANSTMSHDSLLPNASTSTPLKFQTHHKAIQEAPPHVTLAGATLGSHPPLPPEPRARARMAGVPALTRGQGSEEEFAPVRFSLTKMLDSFDRLEEAIHEALAGGAEAAAGGDGVAVGEPAAAGMQEGGSGLDETAVSTPLLPLTPADTSREDPSRPNGACAADSQGASAHRSRRPVDSAEPQATRAAVGSLAVATPRATERRQEPLLGLASSVAPGGTKAVPLTPTIDAETAAGPKSMAAEMWEFLQSELVSSDFDESYDVKKERVQNFLAVPMELEKLMTFGYFICLDSFLYIFTILPMRIAIASWTLLRSLFTRGVQLKAAQKCDIMKGALVVACWLMLENIDASRLYHSIRLQATVKLYVIFNVLEVGDKLCSAFGHDILDSLFSKTTVEYTRQSTSASARRLGRATHFAVALLYVFVHSMMLFYQVMTLNATVNSHSSSLLTLLISNQFVEIKGNVFKKFERENLFQLSCSDIVERFQLSIFLVIITFRNFVEVVGGETVDAALRGVSHGLSAFSTTILAWMGGLATGELAWPPEGLAAHVAGLAGQVGDWDLVRDPSSVLHAAVDWALGRLAAAPWVTIKELLVPVVLVYATEILVDWLKHAFITKFNQIKPSVYARFSDSLCRDLLGGRAYAARGGVEGADGHAPGEM
ncbi:hypothetical protein HK405_013225, partial [Cladochytrium tenue]